jgi:uncharacterized membrane protein YfbV (UPF0208 family)
MGVIAYTAILWRRVRGHVCGSACTISIYKFLFPLRPLWLRWLGFRPYLAYCAKNSKFAMLGSSRFSSSPKPYVPTIS